ncbi:eIF4-gamma eIF5 eIF2b-epsilon carboxy-terminal domain-containing protein, putative [Babesia ovata]|uniref:eIF4-gamma eIF5 eIF2b-epsilon carboxy-terminal domain-containing protein, putative n=1 Tax=Babesia ovata TaxID=189622 RepID=A0A2H6KJA0_9APIC|nr:eIF4-gamma eIF5 eIF2b-epsilon carboxy-terminal domain-containing protein, putative [Babesia ovata]GBE63074.1 eIF4-gamma eIF5 eIF2b-epsilon carboxy-terminal domain-containing protein, putative [Babesia ovata]
MAAKKPISVNLRDLQRVLNEGKPEMPRFSSGAIGEEEDEQQGSSFGVNRQKSGPVRWANEDDDDDYDERAARDDKPEPDFSTVRSTENQFSRSEQQSYAGGRSSSPDGEGGPDDDVWRSGARQTAPDPVEEDDVWRRPSTGGAEDGRSGDFKRDGGMANDEDDMFNRSSMQRDSRGKKLYVPPSKKYESTAFNAGEGSSGGNSRFSCLDTGYERSYTTSNAESNKAWEAFSMQRRDSETRESGGYNGRDAFRDLNKENSRSAFFGDQQKSGVYVPAYRRAQTQKSTWAPKNSSVQDIFIKAAGLTETKAAEEKKKPTKPEPQKVQEQQQPQPDPQVQQMREAVLRHNRMYEANHETIKNVVDAAKTLISGGAKDIQQLVPEDEEELVPAVVACLVAAKACETCSTLEEVHDKFGAVAPLVVELCERREENIEGKLLTEVTKFICAWKLPAIGESLYLLEAVFDALLHCKVVTPTAALQWLENIPDDVPDRVSVIIQLLPWKKWLLGETLEAGPAASAHESEGDDEDEEEEEDIDIEALVPKPVRISKTMPF